MNKNKFKVGDIVRGNAKSDEWYGITNSKMTKGEVVGVDYGFMRIKVIEHKNGRYIGNTFLVKDMYFDLVKPNKVLIYQNGKEVIAKDTTTGRTGVARCCPEDEFDFGYGARLALERLYPTKSEEPPKYLNCKFVVTESEIENSQVTVGKIYEMKDGRFETDKGNLFPCIDLGRSIAKIKDEFDLIEYFNGTRQIEHFANFKVKVTVIKE